MDETLLNFWLACRQQLLGFRASTPFNNTPAQNAAALQALAANLESQARTVDPNRRTSPYNLPSLYQDEMSALASKTVYLAQKWINDGHPAVPTV